MSNVKASLATFFTLLSIASAYLINTECQDQKNNVTCECRGKEEFSLPGEYNYQNMTSLSISSCTAANLVYPSLLEATGMTKFVVSNINERLTLDLTISTTYLSLLELTNVREIPAIKHDLFNNVKIIDNLVLRNVLIESFAEHFTEIKVANVTMVNVTINNVEGFNFTEGGNKLEITNCVFRNITKSLNFHFPNLKITNSTFEMVKPTYFHINSVDTLLRNNVFINVNMEVFGKTGVTINNTCADGQSNLRISAFDIKSFNNRWPTDIIFTPDRQNQLKKPLQGNNVVCIAGNCKCPRSNGRNGNQTITATFLLEIFLICMTYALSQL